MVGSELLLVNEMQSLIVEPFSIATSSGNNELIIRKGSTITEYILLNIKNEVKATTMNRCNYIDKKDREKTATA